MSYYPEPDNHIRDKIKVVPEFPDSATKKEIEHATSPDTSDLAAKKDFVGLKTENDKRNINRLVNVPTSLNDFFKKVDDSDVGKLKIAPVDLKKLSDVVDNEVAINTKFNILRTKVSNLDQKIPNVATLIHINQYKTDD